MNLKVDLVELGRRRPSSRRVLHQLDPVALHPVRELERAGADRLRRCCRRRSPARRSPRRPSRGWRGASPSALRAPILTVASSIAVTSLMPANRSFCALIESSASARSKEKITSSALNGVPSWNFTPVRAGGNPGEAVRRDLPALGQRRQDRAVRRRSGSAPRRRWRRPPRRSPPPRPRSGRGCGGSSCMPTTMSVRGCRNAPRPARNASADRDRRQCREVLHRSPPPPAGGAPPLLLPRRRADRPAPRPITVAASTMSSTPTYSSGWCARSRMPGP